MSPGLYDLLFPQLQSCQGNSSRGEGVDPESLQKPSPPTMALRLLTLASPSLPELSSALCNDRGTGATEVYRACAYTLHVGVWKGQGHKATYTFPTHPFSLCGLEQSQAAATHKARVLARSPGSGH